MEGMNLPDLVMIVNIVYLAFAGLFVLIGVLVGLKRGLFKSAVRLIFLVLSAVGAALVVTIIVNSTAPTLTNLVMDNKDSLVGENAAMVNEVLEASPTITEYLPLIVVSAVAPIAFLLLFIVFSLISLGLGAIVKAIFKKMLPEKPGVVSRILGMVLSMACGVVIATCSLLPVTGYLTLAGNTYEKLEAAEVIQPTEDENAEKLTTLVKDGKELFIVKTEYFLGGPLFKWSTSYKISSGEGSNLVDDVDGYSDLVPVAMDLSKVDFSDVENIDVQPFRKITAVIKDRAALRTVIAEILSYASDKWVNYEEFLGLNIKESLPEDLKDSFDPALNKLAQTTPDTVTDDLNQFIDEIEALGKSYSSIERLSKTDFSDISAVDLSPINDIIDAIENTVIVKEIVANVISDAGERWLNGQAFMEMNIEEQLPEEFKGLLTPAFQMFADTTKDNVIAHLREFVNLFGDVQGVLTEVDALQETQFDVEHLADLDITPLNNIATKIDEAKSSLTKELVAGLIAKVGTAWGNSEEFMGINIEEQLPEEFKGLFDPAYDSFASATKNDVGEKLVDFANMLDDVKTILGRINDLTEQSFDGDNLDSVDVTPIKAIAGDVENAESTLTKELVAGLVSRAGTSWLTPEEFLGLDIKSQLPNDYKNSLDSMLTKLSNTTKQTVGDDLNGFADTIASISKTYAYVKAFSSTEADMTDMATALTDALSTVTDDNKEILADLMTDVIGDVVANEGTAEVVTGIITRALDTIAEQNASGDGTSSEVADYAEAVNTIINYTSSESTEEVSASSIVETVTASQTLSNVIKDYTSDEESASIDVDEEQKAAISSAIQSYEEENEETLTDEEKETLEALKKLFGITTP